MKVKSKIILATLLLLSASFTAKVSQAQSVTLGVEFGHVQAGGGDCVGTSVCDCNVAGSLGINVQFSVTSDGSTLVMQFSWTDLKNSQPDQVTYFASGAYVFDGTYSLSSSLFSSLNLPTGAVINSSSNGTLSIDGDVVTVYETIYTQ